MAVFCEFRVVGGGVDAGGSRCAAGFVFAWLMEVLALEDDFLSAFDREMQTQQTDGEVSFQFAGGVEDSWVVGGVLRQKIGFRALR